MTNLEFQRGAIDAGGCISTAWEMLKSNYGLYLGIAIIALIMTGCIPCLNLFLVGPIMGGIAYVVLRDMRREPVEFGMMFQGFQKFVPLMVIGLLQAIPGIIMQGIQFTFRFAELGMRGNRNGDFDYFQSSGVNALGAGVLLIIALVGIAFAILGIVWWACFFFAIPLAMEHDLGPVDAIKLSARAAMANIGGLILILILTVLIMIGGMLLLCVGMFLVSVPLVYIANVVAYRQVFPSMPTQFNMTPPPPSSYGGGYGQQNFGV